MSGVLDGLVAAFAVTIRRAKAIAALGWIPEDIRQQWIGSPYAVSTADLERWAAELAS